MHTLLARQIQSHFGEQPVPPGLGPFLAAVSEAYEQAEIDRARLGRSLDLTAHELMEANEALRRDRQRLEERVAERTAEVSRLNETLHQETTGRRQAEAELMLSEDRYYCLFEESQDVVYVSTREGRLVDINPAGVRLFGFSSREELLAADLTTLYARPEDRARIVEQLDREGRITDVEVDLQTRDGQLLTVLLTSRLICDTAGRPCGFRGFIRDMTRQRTLERNLRTAQKMEALGRLAGGVAHDFNNLLAIIHGYADALERSLPHHPSVITPIEKIRWAAERGGQLTRQLLALGRHQILAPRPLDLNAVIAGLEAPLRRVIEEHIHVTLDLDPGLPPVDADPGQLEQVLLNLVINARDAMPGGGELVIGTRFDDAADAGAPPVCMTVQDSGTGISSADLERIFDPFFTTKETGKGTGLGLAIVYGIVEQSGGRISVESRPGAGTRFTIRFPASAAALAPAPLGAATIQDHPSPGGRILLAEDEPEVRGLLVSLLKEEGYEVHSAADGQAALDMAESTGPIDLLVTDMVMPRLGGLPLALRMKARDPALKVLVVSGFAEEPTSVLEHPALQGSVSFLQKPFNLANMSAEIRRILARTDARAA